MDKIIKFDGTEIEEYKFHQIKGPSSIKDIDINKIVVLYKFPFSVQYFKSLIGYEDAEKNQTFMHVSSRID